VSFNIRNAMSGQSSHETKRECQPRYIKKQGGGRKYPTAGGLRQPDRGDFCSSKTVSTCGIFSVQHPGEKTTGISAKKLLKRTCRARIWQEKEEEQQPRQVCPNPRDAGGWQARSILEATLDAGGRPNGERLFAERQKSQKEKNTGERGHKRTYPSSNREAWGSP